MPTTETVSFNWHDAINDTFEDAINAIISFAPALFGAIALLLIGWLVARILRFFTKKAVRGVDSIFQKGIEAADSNAYGARKKFLHHNHQSDRLLGRALVFYSGKRQSLGLEDVCRVDGWHHQLPSEGYHRALNHPRRLLT